MEEGPRYNVQRHRKANVRVTLRAVVAFYLVYLGWSVVKTSGGADSSMKPWMAWGIFALFTAVAVAFGVYAYKQYRLDLKDAEARPEDDPVPEAEDTPALDDGADEEDDHDETDPS